MMDVASDTTDPVCTLLRRRPYARGTVFAHGTGRQSKNESNCTVFLPDGRWLTTWSQGCYEGHPEQQIVGAFSEDEGLSWSAPFTIESSRPETDEMIAYGIPFVAPELKRVYLFFFVCIHGEGRQWAQAGQPSEGRRHDSQRGCEQCPRPEHGAGQLHFVYSDDQCRTWSSRIRVKLPDRDINVLPGYHHACVNHPPRIMADGTVLFTFSGTRIIYRAYQLNACEANVVRCENILSERDTHRLEFTLLPRGPRGIRVNVLRHAQNQALQRLLRAFDGCVADSGYTFEEMTLVDLPGGRWLGVGRTMLGSPCFTISVDRGESWTSPEPLRYRPGGPLIKHPMTMCPVASTTDGRIVLLFTNNDGTDRGAAHIWDEGGTTRNPQWLVVGRAMANVEDNAGLIFGSPFVLAETAPPTPEEKEKAGISMPQFLQWGQRFFVCYNINKRDILLDEIPPDRMTV